MKKIMDKNKKKLILLAVVLGVYTLIVTPLLIINLQKQQQTNSNADTVTWSTSQSAQTTCSQAGTAEINYAFTNTETSSSQNMDVTIKDSTTGKTVDLGQVDAGQTKTGTLDSGINTLSNGTITFNLAWTTNTSQTDQRTASYNAISCQPQANVCPIPSTGGTPKDDMVIIDKSGSMDAKVGSSGTKISNAKSSASNFVDILSANTNNRVGLVTFSSTATLNSPFTTNYSSVKSQISNISTGGNTCIQCAIDTANQEIASHALQGSKRIVVLLTDGKANTIEGSTNQTDQVTAEQKALAAAQASHNANGTIFYTIGLGSDVNTSFLQQIASNTGGQYYFSATTDQLNTIYTQVAQELAKGSISGSVFNDANNNASFDSSEQKLSGWTLQLFTSGSNTPLKTITTDNTGSFIFGSLCSGTYILKEVPQTGWKQTLPANNGSYTINLGSGDTITDKNFGNYFAPTSTPIPTATPKPTLTPTPMPTATTAPTPTGAWTSISLTVFQHGIGNSGDNSNPDQFSLSNKNPLHTSIPADIQVYNVNNQLVASGAGVISYDPTTGNYKSGLICSGGNSFQTGKYNIKVKTAYHLRRLLPGIQTINVGQNNDMPAITLVAGDVNNDNQLNILDYNTLLGCYSDLAAAPACSDQTKKVASDLNDDGQVNQVDYNLFLREISTQPGQ
jgi:Mg-chelatase subunit ChlD